jgi:two-component system LytT family sensor kinase
MSDKVRTPIPLKVIWGVALLMATLFLVQAYMHHYVYSDIKGMSPFKWWVEAPVPYLNFLFWAFLCPVVFRLVRRWPFSMRPTWKPILAHALFGLLLGTLHEVVTSTVYYAILTSTGDLKWEPNIRTYVVHALAPGILQRFMEYWTLLVIFIAVDNARQMRDKQTQLLKMKHQLDLAQLDALRKQLQPHFLFNTLNTVSAMMEENASGARRVLSRLGQVLRITLDRDRQDKVPLADEVDHIANFLGIESERFSDRLKVHYQVPAPCMDALVPTMVLQPLVENAIKHGLDRTTDGVEITVAAERLNGSIRVLVQDNGKGCPDPAGAMAKGGIGLRNVRDRLKLLYGSTSAFEIHSPSGRGFSVILEIPYEPAGRAS